MLIKIIVFTFSDPSVGIYGEELPFNIELPDETWNFFDETEKKEFIEKMKKLAVDVIDPDGSAMTQEEIELENEQWEIAYKEEQELQEKSFSEEI